MCNEGELLERFQIQLSPIPMPELTEAVKEAKADQAGVKEVTDHCRGCMNIAIQPEELENVAALKMAMKTLA